MHHDHDPRVFPLANIADSRDGSRTFVLSQHPLLAQSPSVRRDLLDLWYCSNNFVVGFDLTVSEFERTDLERALGLLGARMSTLLFTSMGGVISPRLRINCGDAGDTVTFEALVQWAELFYRGFLSEERFASISTGLGNGPPHPSHYQFVWESDPCFADDETRLVKLLNELRKEMANLATDANRDVDVRRYLYDWLVDDSESDINDRRLRQAKARVCAMIGEAFKALGYEDAMQMYS
ncbi:hypothetical protein KCU92_g5351, partial [Aureobasidium melanogenum]